MQESILIQMGKEDLEKTIETIFVEVLNKQSRSQREKELLSSKELCSWLGVSMSTVNAWKSMSKIPYRRLGKKIFFQKSEVLKAFEHSNYSRIKEITG
jgi:excisionase family DNA binding protein